MLDLAAKKLGDFESIPKTKTRLIALNDGSALLCIAGNNEKSKAYLIKSPSKEIIPLNIPADPYCWFISIPQGLVLMGEPKSLRFVLWNPLTDETDEFYGEVPIGRTICCDILDDQVFIVISETISGSDAGFDWSDETTHLAIFNWREKRFEEPFHRVEDHDMQFIAMQNANELVGFWFSRSGSGFSLYDINLKALQRTQERWDCFRISHDHYPKIVGKDQDNGVLIFGAKSRNGERVLMRWTLKARKFETVVHFSERDTSFNCSVVLPDGRFLLFCRIDYTDYHQVYLYKPDQTIQNLGQLELKLSSGLVVDNNLYLLGSSEIYTINLDQTARL